MMKGRVISGGEERRGDGEMGMGRAGELDNDEMVNISGYAFLIHRFTPCYRLLGLEQRISQSSGTKETLFLIVAVADRAT